MHPTPVLPSLFLSHGAPDMLLGGDATADRLGRLAGELPRPTAIVIVSAHWIGDPVGITGAGALETIHDFAGFPAELYARRYPAEGSGPLAGQVAALLNENGMDTLPAPDRGLDHGAWAPLSLMYPAADIPVVQVALPAGSLKDVARMGAALSPLRRQGVLLIGSGGSTHNLRAINRAGVTDDWAIAFETWLHRTVETGRFEHVIDSTHLPAMFNMAHPTMEHYAPLVFAWAAGDSTQPGRRIHNGFTYGNLGMSFFRFENADGAPAPSKTA